MIFSLGITGVLPEAKSQGKSSNLQSDLDDQCAELNHAQCQTLTPPKTRDCMLKKPLTDFHSCVPLSGAKNYIQQALFFESVTIRPQNSSQAQNPKPQPQIRRVLLIAV